ncbi:MAG: aminotransferase class III-fold pyridoxal phosphate-dependent enzyme, partial [Armatimonadota bacterium]
RVALPSFFRGLSELAEKHGVALAFDEVQTGLGATGKNFAIDHFELPYPPLAVATGKKFGTGVVYMYQPLEEFGILDSTWGGTLSDMVRVVRELEIVKEEDLISKAATNGAYLVEKLLALQARHKGFVGNVRGMGLYQGFSVKDSETKAKVVKIARESYSLLLLGAGNHSIRLRPNLSVTRGDIDLLCELLHQVFTEAA